MRAFRPSLLLFLAFIPLNLQAQKAATSDPGPAGSQSPNTVEVVDLRSSFEQFGLVPRQEGGLPTCSVFTIAGAVEFAVAKRQGRTPRLSVEFLNWAAGKVRGDSGDGGFFSDLWKGFSAYGMCSEPDMPYESKLDPKRFPSVAALADAKVRLSLGLRLHWIKEWN